MKQTENTPASAKHQRKIGSTTNPISTVQVSTREFQPNNICQENIIKKARMSVLLSDDVDFRTKKITKDRSKFT